jgi:hypothetical protein
MLDSRKFFQATDPGRALRAENPEDKKYYIDFSSVRGGNIIGKLTKRIAFFLPDSPTCTLFTGHIGCGKSTELRRLQAELEEEGFHVVYFESSEDLELTDVDIIDLLLAIARRISQSLDKIKLEEPNKLKDLLAEAWNVLNADVQGFKVKLPTPGGDLNVNAKDETFTLAFGIGEITAKAKQDSLLRKKLNQDLGPQKTQLLDAINKELIEPAIAKLKQQGKKGLVAIVDNLDRLDTRPKPWGRPQQEYLFVDQGQSLTKLQCNVVYTMPFALKFSKDYGNLTQRFAEHPKVLPMVTVQSHDGTEHEKGMALLRQMVLARAFPDLDEQQRLKAIPEIFDSQETLDRLCRASGGHVRDLLKLLNSCIMEEMVLPLSRQTLEGVIRTRRNDMALPISDAEWELLRQVRRRKRLSDPQEYQTLLRSRLVFEYWDAGEYLFDVNPLLAEAKELQE